MRRGRSLLLILSCLLAGAASATAQDKEPIGRFAVDVRGTFLRHKSEPAVANALGLQTGNLPKRSWGLAGGAHFYFWHTNKVTLGIGANVITAQGSEQIETQVTDGTVTKSPKAIRKFDSVGPEFSLNFGHRRGWSYISGGMFGLSKLYVERADTPATNMPRRKTLNYGAGARWFARQHLAFSVDVRWYSVKEPTQPSDLQPATTLLVLAGGISFK